MTPPQKEWKIDDKWLDNVLDQERSIKERDFFVLDLSNLIMRNPFLWKKVQDQLKREAVEEYNQRLKDYEFGNKRLAEKLKCVENIIQEARKELLDEIETNILSKYNTEDLLYSIQWKEFRAKTLGEKYSK